jgi:hypothetical protein
MWRDGPPLNAFDRISLTNNNLRLYETAPGGVILAL